VTVDEVQRLTEPKLSVGELTVMRY
jgi:hypothetical protein